tara:strand:+ start:3285 stop:4430 length:1146 start_codon:yes stop_codon:yes gene_type:complete
MAINTRSPYFTDSPSLGASTYATCRIYIYTGDKNATPTIDPNYTIRKNITSPNTFATFEVAELIRDFIDVNFDGTYSSVNQDAIWVLLVKDTYNDATLLQNSERVLSLDSFSYFEDPNFNVDNTSAMISNNIIYHLNGDGFTMPVNTLNNPTLTFTKNNVVTATKTYTSSTLSDEQIKYATGNPVGTLAEYEAYVLADGGTFETSTCLESLLDVYGVPDFDKIQITDDNGTSFINVKMIDECKYEPKKITFINKFGALQNMYFFKKSVGKMTLNKETYKSNIITSGNTYSINNHVNRDFNVVGKESITLSSGFLSEEYNEVFKQMLLSEKVWITNYINGVEQILPLNIKTSNITYKTSLNDKLVEYTFDFDNSYDTINNIR